MYLLNRLAGGCLQSISLVRRALTVVTKEAARNIGSRMSRLVGNNQPDQDVIFSTFGLGPYLHFLLQENYTQPLHTSKSNIFRDLEKLSLALKVPIEDAQNQNEIRGRCKKKKVKKN